MVVHEDGLTVISGKVTTSSLFTRNFINIKRIVNKSYKIIEAYII